MPVPWPPTRWQDLHLSEDEKKRKEIIFMDKVGKSQKLAEEIKMLLVRVGSIQLGGTWKLGDKKLCMKT